MHDNISINPEKYKAIMFFTGAGMSAESGVPTYRGSGGVWSEYNWEEYACQRAFDKDPEKVIAFHELRRKKLLQCQPHAGHQIITRVQKKHPDVSIVTQNIDGMHQRAGSTNVIELHGSIWRMRCHRHGIFEDMGEKYASYRCLQCGNRLRPDITWFEDMLNAELLARMETLLQNVDLFIAIGTSGVVYPAAIYPQLAKQCGANTVCINTEVPGDNSVYDVYIKSRASDALLMLFNDFIG